MSYTRREPFGRINDQSNNNNNNHNFPTSSSVGGSRGQLKKLQPPSKYNHVPRRLSRGHNTHTAGSSGGVSSILAKNAQSRANTANNIGSSKRMQLLDPPSSPTSSPQQQQHPSTNNENDDNINYMRNRSRVYKAETYEAKIRIASQEQRIEALEAELEEVKIFNTIEGESERMKKDGEMIELLAAELETMEKKLLLQQPSQNLEKQLEKVTKEAAQYRKDAADGLPLMKELDRNLRKARTERNDWKSKHAGLTDEMAQTQKEREQALLDVSSYRKEVKALHKEVKELEDLLWNTKTQTIGDMEEIYSNKIADIKQHHELEIKEMVIQNKCTVSSIEAAHANEIKMNDDLQQSHEVYWVNNVNELRNELTDAQTKIKTLETNKLSTTAEKESLKERLKEFNIATTSIDMDCPLDEVISNFKIENRMLKENLQRGLEIHNRTTAKLEEKTLELQKLQASKKEGTDTDTLRNEYAAAVLKIQTLQKEVIKLGKLEKKAEATNSTLPQEPLTQSTKGTYIEKLASDLATAQESDDLAHEKGKRKMIEDAVLSEYLQERMMQNEK